YYREKLTQSINDQAAMDELNTVVIRGFSSGDAWPKSARDVLMKLVYESREKEELKTVVQRLRTLDWKQQIEDQYFTAMCYALPGDGKATEKPMWGGMENWVSYEAAQDFVRVVGSRKSQSIDAIRMRVAKETIRAFDELP